MGLLNEMEIRLELVFVFKYYEKVNKVYFKSIKHQVVF
jgi:hypothetical protein